MHSLRTRFIVIAGAAAVTGLSAALFFDLPGRIAAQPNAVVAPTASPAGLQGDSEARKQRHDQVMASVAANLGVTPERLAEAFAQARKDQIQELVQQGKITQEQADRMIARINQGPKADGTARIQNGANPGAAGQPGARVPGPQVRAIGGVVAQTLGLTPKDLRDALNSGKTLAQLAQDKGLSLDQLRIMVSDQLEQRLNAAVQVGSLTDEQAAQIRARHQQMIEHLISGQPRHGRGKPAQS